MKFSMNGLRVHLTIEKNKSRVDVNATLLLTVGFPVSSVK